MTKSPQELALEGAHKILKRIVGYGYDSLHDVDKVSQALADIEAALSPKEAIPVDEAEKILRSEGLGPELDDAQAKIEQGLAADQKKAREALDRVLCGGKMSDYEIQQYAPIFKAALQPPPPAIESVNRELLKTIRQGISATSEGMKHQKLCEALQIANAESAMKPACEGVEGPPGSREKIIQTVDDEVAMYDEIEYEPEVTVSGKSLWELRNLAVELMAENDALDKAAHDKTMELISTRQQASAAIPPGYVLVPREPTEKMNAAGMVRSCMIPTQLDNEPLVSKVYKAMIEAAAKDGGGDAA